MQFRVITGLDFDVDYLKTVMDLDTLVYSAEYAGVLENMVARWKANHDQFLGIIDTSNNVLAGYVCFFPCTQELYWDITVDTQVIRDDDIGPEEIAQYSNEVNHLFIISFVVHPSYRDTSTIVTLSDAWIEYLNKLVAKGYPITDISGITISEDGAKICNNYCFDYERTLEDGNVLYMCKGDSLKDLLAHKLRVGNVAV